MKKIILYSILIFVFLGLFFVIINLSVKTTNKNDRDVTTTTKVDETVVRRALSDSTYINGNTAKYWENYFIELYKKGYNVENIQYHIDFHDPVYTFYVTDDNDYAIEIYTMTDGVMEITNSKNEKIEIK